MRKQTEGKKVELFLIFFSHTLFFYNMKENMSILVLSFYILWLLIVCFLMIFILISVESEQVYYFYQLKIIIFYESCCS